MRGAGSIPGLYNLFSFSKQRGFEAGSTESRFLIELLPTFNFLRTILQVSIGLCFGLTFASAVT
jgi:hypothetical protein